ncbi:hypothetical protein CA13_26480 [Planctomycetes bacterium CA13]|uniref:Uncharacterized protein n=1 Tax=Novipirellula herctigrandis TaxID=2527986 RepID=A0A5C5Z1K1_9BACT|nr:hypothetical protein CA13_26480 [Planctomycetes bacterium CA13]
MKKQRIVPDCLSGHLLIRETDRDELVADVAAAVVIQIRSLLRERSEPVEEKIKNRPGMAKYLGWSISKLDDRTASGLIPSILDGGRRIYVVADVLEALRERTPEAEAKAKKRQAAKTAARRKMEDIK